MSHIPPSRFKRIRSLRDWSAAWSVFASVVCQLNPAKCQDLLAYFILISGAAERSDFDWLAYDYKFRQSVVVSSDKPWGIPHPSIWLQCMGRRSFYQYSTYSRRGYSGNSEATCCMNFKKKNECLYPNCKYLHRCSSCKIGSHPAIVQSVLEIHPRRVFLNVGGLDRLLRPPNQSIRSLSDLHQVIKNLMLRYVLMTFCCLTSLILALFHVIRK